jgi:hypothetical protein
MKTFGQIFCFLILTTLLIGCSDDDNNDLGLLLNQASVRVLHASPDAPNVDVLPNSFRFLREPEISKLMQPALRLL